MLEAMTVEQCCAQGGEVGGGPALHSPYVFSEALDHRGACPHQLKQRGGTP